MLVFPPGLNFVAALFGCFYAGCVAVPAPYLIGKRAAGRCAAIFQDCAPAAVLTLSRLEGDAELRGAIQPNSNDVDWIHVDAAGAPPRGWVPGSIDPGAQLRPAARSYSARFRCARLLPPGWHRSQSVSNVPLLPTYSRSQENAGAG